MRSRLMSLITVVVLGLLFSAVAFGQTKSRQQQPAAGTAAVGELLCLERADLGLVVVDLLLRLALGRLVL